MSILYNLFCRSTQPNKNVSKIFCRLSMKWFQHGIGNRPKATWKGNRPKIFNKILKTKRKYAWIQFENPVSTVTLYCIFHFGNLSYWPSEPRGSFVSNKWVMKHKIQHLLIFGVSLTLQRTHARALKLGCYTNAFWQSHHSLSLLLTSECSHYLGNFTGEMVSTKQTCGSWMGPT